ncbi:hypothetical protein TL16_g07327 [Triparma laevis f. inornata]|uniref:Uncharacterized protein n=1 Tax=Triparma laevis f. inornata TaxID=1714386 RepID=A0A9W7AV61_9STRA|nr:hypothetical protein TL16_g07327 [Triparma laevis f. inornata]
MSSPTRVAPTPSKISENSTTTDAPTVRRNTMSSIRRSFSTQINKFSNLGKYMYIEGAANLALIVRNAILMHSLQHAKTHAANLTLIAGAAMSFTDLAFDLVLINEYLGYYVWAA